MLGIFLGISGINFISKKQTPFFFQKGNWMNIIFAGNSYGNRFTPGSGHRSKSTFY
jgi:hypothetical protein